MMDYIKIALIAGSLIAGFGISYFWPSAPPDNAIEELAEDILKQQTGIDIDFTPESHDNK